MSHTHTQNRADDYANAPAAKVNHEPEKLAVQGFSIFSVSLVK